MFEMVKSVGKENLHDHDARNGLVTIITLTFIKISQTSYFFIGIYVCTITLVYNRFENKTRR